MAETLQYSGRLTVTVCWCGMRHAIPEELHELQLRQHRDGNQIDYVYCPLGHGYAPAGEGQAAQLQRKLTRELASHDQTKAALRTTESKLKSTEARRRGEKAAKTRIKNRTDFFLAVSQED